MNFSKNSILQLHKELQRVWPEGRYKGSVTGSGGHWRLPNQTRPVSISTMEGHFLANLVFLMGGGTILEIGTGFGYSMLWIALGLSHCSGVKKRLISIDNYSEGEEATVNQRFAQRLIARYQLSEFCELHVGDSPKSIAPALKSDLIDIAFIDGGHRAEQPIKDYRELVRHLSSDGLIVWHDNWCEYSVPKAIHIAEEDGFSSFPLDTSCRLCVSFNGDNQRRLIEESFSAARAKRLVFKDPAK